MSRENVESVRSGIDAWNRGDLEEWLLLNLESKEAALEAIRMRG